MNLMLAPMSSPPPGETHSRVSPINSRASTGCWMVGFLAGASLLLGCRTDPASPDEGGPHDRPAPEVLFPYADSMAGAIRLENSLTGSSRWHETGRSTIDIYGSPYSPRRGDTLYIHIGNSAERSGNAEVYRLGWYGGAGGRQILRSEIRNVPVATPCTASSPPPVECSWRGLPVTVVDSSWLAGVYLLRFESSDGAVGFYPFVVPSTRSRDLMGIVPQFTWQAYNDYGGSSLYRNDPATGTNATKVSFQRPYRQYRGLMTTGGEEAGGSNDIQAVRFFEREGVDIGYLSDLDLADSSRALPPGFKGLIFLGHDEYWTWQMFDRVEALRDAGIHLAFLSANSAYWHIRLEPSGIDQRPFSRITCFKRSEDVEAPSPERRTTMFRAAPLSRPENSLVGVMPLYLLPVGMDPPMLVAPDSLRGEEGAAILAAAGVQAGDTIGVLAGREVDQLVSNSETPAGIQVLFQNRMGTGGSTRYLHSTFYRAPSGAGVYATGTNRWAFYLDDYYGVREPRVEGVTRAVVQWMLTH